MAIHSFLKAEKGDPDWQFSPEQYFGKEFKIVDASTIEVAAGVTDRIELRQNPTDKNLLAKHIKIEAKEESQLDILVMNEADAKLQQVCIYDLVVREGATVNFGAFVKGGKFNKHIVQVFLEEGANFSVYGLLGNDTGGDTELITKIVHQGLESQSRQLIISTANNASQTVYQGTVVLEPGCEGSDASIESLNLNAGGSSRCFSKPEIYVNCDGVKSSVGSITESLDNEKIYYLQSRGLDPKKAVKTIVDSFQNQAINLVTFDDLRNEIRQIFA